MPIDSKECFAALTEDGQLWEIYQAAQTGGGASGPAGGDLTGTYPNPTVDGLQGTPVSSATPYNGQVLQFDGTSWVPGSIPSGGSGGGGVVYFLNFNTAADAPVTNIPQTPNTSKELAIAVDTAATSYTSAHLPTASYAFLGSFVTDLNVPSATSVPAGLWDFNIYAQSSTTNVANQVYFKIEVLKYDGVNAPTLISTSGDTYIYDPTEVTQYVSSCIIPSGVTLTATDRLVVYLYGRAHQANKDITFHFGSTYPSHTHSTMPSVTGTGVVKVVNGVFQSPASTIVNSDVSASAAIDKTKIAGTAITAADTGTVTSTMIADGTIVDADINASAAIGVSKLAMSTNRLLGRTTAGTGAVEQITVGTGLSLSAGTLTNTVSAGVTSVTATAPLTSSGGATPDISTSIATNRIVGRSTAGTGVMEQLTPVGITVSGGNITGIGGTVGTVDNAVPRADGTGGYTVQGSDIVIDDAVPFLSGVAGLDSTDYITVVGNTFVANQQIFFGSLTGGSALTVNTPYFVRDVGGAGANTFRISTTSGGAVQSLGSDITAGTVGAGQTNVAIVNNHVGQTNSSLVLTPKGTGALIAGPKPDGTTTGGNARGARANDFQKSRGSAGQVASGTDSVICGGSSNTASGSTSFIGSGTNNSTPSNGSNCAIVGGQNNTFSGSPFHSFIGGGSNNRADFPNCAICAGDGNYIANVQSGFIGAGISNRLDTNYTAILGGDNARADRYGMQAHASGRFSPVTGNFGDAQRARFVLRCKTTTNAAVEMALDGGTTYLSIPNNKVIFMNIKIVGARSTGAEIATYERQYAVKNVALTSSQVYAPVTIGTDNAAGTVLDLSVVDAAGSGTDYVSIKVTGIASQTWRWVASVDAVEVELGT